MISLSLILILMSFGIVLYIYFEYNKSIVQLEKPSFFCGVIKQHNNPVAFTPEQIYGEKLFKTSCISCHSPTDEIIVGPGLKGISKRRKLKWIVRWVNNPLKVIANGDKYAVDVYNKFNKLPMTPFPGLKEKDVKAILAYIDAN